MSKYYLHKTQWDYFVENFGLKWVEAHCVLIPDRIPYE